MNNKTETLPSIHQLYIQEIWTWGCRWSVMHVCMYYVYKYVYVCMSLCVCVCVSAYMYALWVYVQKAYTIFRVYIYYRLNSHSSLSILCTCIICLRFSQSACPPVHLFKPLSFYQSFLYIYLSIFLCLTATWGWTTTEFDINIYLSIPTQFQHYELNADFYVLRSWNHKLAVNAFS